MPSGFKLVPKIGKRKWMDVDLTSELRKRGISDDQMYGDRPLATVVQLERLVGKKRFAAEFSDLVTRNTSGVDLVPLDDMRPSINDVSDFEPV